MLAVSWGILMLVLLMAAGTGLENNVRWEFRDDAVNSIWIYGGRTSRPFEGHAVGRRVRFDNDDFASLAEVPAVDKLTGRFYPRGDTTVSYDGRKGSFNIRATHPDHKYVEGTLIVAGRFIDELDLKERRKVAVIGQEVVKFLFEGIDPIGEWLNVGGVNYQIIGIFEDVGGPGEMRQIYLPITTGQLVYGGGERIDQLMFTVDPDMTIDESERLTEQVRGQIARHHHFDPSDRRAMRVRNNVERFGEIQAIFGWIRAFIWIVGVGTVLAGVVGVSNILLVSVQERTSEIGLRKAVGATPSSLIGMVMQEAIVLTSVAGYGGVVVGVGLVEVVRRYVPENDYIRDPQADLGVVIGAVALLVALGTLAGLFPALRAANIDPITALREE
ncbi:MAG: ABC transporter permease [Proteobacteria bacterium]|nr:ABC transporter permease [Pseudomonadota bacterium]